MLPLALCINDPNRWLLRPEKARIGTALHVERRRGEHCDAVEMFIYCQFGNPAGSWRAVCAQVNLDSQLILCFEDLKPC